MCGSWKKFNNDANKDGIFQFRYTLLSLDIDNFQFGMLCLNCYVYPNGNLEYFGIFHSSFSITYKHFPLLFCLKVQTISDIIMWMIEARFLLQVCVCTCVYTCVLYSYCYIYIYMLIYTHTCYKTSNMWAWL